MSVPTTPVDANVATSSPALIALSWLVVIIPAAWGVYLTALRAANLFK
jgi:hypothetical protein